MQFSGKIGQIVLEQTFTINLFQKKCLLLMKTSPTEKDTMYRSKTKNIKFFCYIRMPESIQNILIVK